MFCTWHPCVTRQLRPWRLVVLGAPEPGRVVCRTLGVRQHAEAVGVCHRAHAAWSCLRVEAAQPRSVNCKAPEPKSVQFRKGLVLP